MSWSHIVCPGPSLVMQPVSFLHRKLLGNRTSVCSGLCTGCTRTPEKKRQRWCGSAWKPRVCSSRTCRRSSFIGQPPQQLRGSSLSPQTKTFTRWRCTSVKRSRGALKQSPRGCPCPSPVLYKSRVAAVSDAGGSHFTSRNLGILLWPFLDTCRVLHGVGA